MKQRKRRRVIAGAILAALLLHSLPVTAVEETAEGEAERMQVSTELTETGYQTEEEDPGRTEFPGESLTEVMSEKEITVTETESAVVDEAAREEALKVTEPASEQTTEPTSETEEPTSQTEFSEEESEDVEEFDTIPQDADSAYDELAETQKYMLLDQKLAAVSYTIQPDTFTVHFTVKAGEDVTLKDPANSTFDIVQKGSYLVYHKNSDGTGIPETATIAGSQMMVGSFTYNFPALTDYVSYDGSDTTVKVSYSINGDEVVSYTGSNVKSSVTVGSATGFKGTIDQVFRAALNATTFYDTGSYKPQGNYGGVSLTTSFKTYAGEADVEITISNPLFEVSIEKVDEFGNLIGGAKLLLSGNSVSERWTTVEGETKTFKLPPSNYRLIEETAPDGYSAGTGGIYFTVNSDGTITTGGETKDTATLTLVNVLKTYNIGFVKTDENSGSLSGAKFQLTGRVLGADEDVEPVTYTASPYINLTVKPGTYTLTETEAPEGYGKADPITFEIGLDGKETITGAARNGSTVYIKDYPLVSIEKVDEKGNRLTGAKLTLDGTYKVPASTWKSGEGITTSSEERTLETVGWISSEEDYKVSLYPGTYTLHEEAAPDGYQIAADIEFVVTDEGKITVDGEEVETVTMKDEKQPETESETQPLTETEPPTESETQKITEPPTESETQKITEPPTESETQKITEPPTETEKPAEVKTGDDTPIWQWVLIGLAALGIVAAALIVLTRKRKRS